MDDILDAHSGSSLTAEELISALTTAEGRDVSGLVAELIRRFEPLTRRIWYRLGGNSTEYPDFRQEAWIKLLRALPKLHDPSAFPGFFKRLTVNSALDELRRSATRARFNVPFNEEVEGQGADRMEDIDNAILVRSYLEALPRRERDVLEKEFLEGFTTAEIAREWNISEGAVRMTKFRAINKLRAIVHAETTTASTKEKGG